MSGQVRVQIAQIVQFVYESRLRFLPKGGSSSGGSGASKSVSQHQVAVCSTVVLNVEDNLVMETKLKIIEILQVTCVVAVRERCFL